MLLLRLALRNLRLHRFKTFLVGTILLIGTALIISGGAILDAIDSGMRRSLINSVSGHLQLYSGTAKDEFQLFGNFDGSMPDIGRINDFIKVHDVVKQVKNVKQVVPMGIDFAVTTTANMLERKLAALRQAVREKNTVRQRTLKHQVHRIVKVLDKDLAGAARLLDIERYKKQYGDYNKALARARQPEFWQNFDSDPLGSLEYLENDVGPLGLGEDVIWVRYLGTDTALFKKTFDRFEIVDGQMIPPGKRGFLFNKRVYEQFIKNKTARRLDRIKERLDEGETIATCNDCQTWIRFNERQAAALVFQLDETADKEVKARLQHELGSKQKETVKLLREFMKMDDANFRQRYKLFYEAIAPRILLYTVPIGGEFVLTAFARGGGYSRKVPVKVYGTFRFRSLDKSPLAGGFNLVDIISFRDLYGYMTAERRKEQVAIRKSVGIKDVKREDAEAALFGGGGDKKLVAEGQTKEFDPEKTVDFRVGGRRFTKAIYQRVYSKKDLWGGVVLNAAVMLEDGTKLEETQAAIRAALAKAKLNVKVVDWQKAAGTVGQIVSVIRVVLYSAVFIIFIVALIIINNSMLMSTMERTREIGTMRAIGAQRGFIMRMFLGETFVLALIFGGLGALAGSAIVLTLGAVGIPASSDFFYFLYAGPRLHPVLHGQHVVAAFFVVALVALLSTWYPARVAMGITPREAMGAEE